MRLIVSNPTHPSPEPPHPKAEVVARGLARDAERSLAHEIRAWARHAARSNGFCDVDVES